MAKDVRVTQVDLLKAVDDAIREAQQALVNVKGKLAAVPGAEDPAAAHDAQTAAKKAQAATAALVEALRPLVIEAQTAEAARESSLA